MHVYLIHAEGTTRYKIGITSRTIESRMKELNSSQAAFPLTLITSIRSENFKAVERHLHEKYKDNRKYGEWFDFSQSELLEVQQYMQIFDTQTSQFKPILKQKPTLSLPAFSLPFKGWILPLTLAIGLVYLFQNVEFFQPRQSTSHSISRKNH